ncbi:hypothetical protein [Streptomyces sp. NPDC047028]|uniref:hypothetical protein n=1 Tax=Streptomyces sp. NPDC047028 TaxID=3155793 RepID=UPI0033C96C84
MNLLAWMPMLAPGNAPHWEPRRLRFRLLPAAAQIVTTGRLRILRRSLYTLAPPHSDDSRS